MGRYFDFTPVKPWAGGLGKVFEGLTEGLEYRDKQRVQDAELAQKKASTEAYISQVEATNKKIRMDEERAARAFEQTQADRDQAAAKAVTSAAAGGRMGEAQAYAAATQRKDPKTGKTLGVTFNPEDPGSAPEAPIEPERPEMLPGQRPDAFVGPVEPPEMARARAMAEVLGKKSTQPPAPGSGEELLSKAAGENAYGMAKRTQDERGRVADEQLQNDINKSTYGRQKADYDVQNAAYEPTKAAYDERKSHPNFTVGINGQQIPYNPREAKDAKAEEARTTAALLRRQAGAPGIDPTIAAQYLRSADQIEAQIPAAAAGAINNTASATQAQGAKKELQGTQITSNEKIASGHDRAKVGAAAMSGGRPGASARGGMSELIAMKEGALGPNGEVLDPHINSKIAARADEIGIPAGGKFGWSAPVGEIVRGPAVAARQRRAEDALEGTDAEGNVTGKYKGANAAREGDKMEVAFGRVRERVKAMLDDVKQYGPRVTEPAAIQRRTNRALEAQAALRVFNGFGSTDFSQKLEHDLQGASGTPDGLANFFLGANPETFQHIIEDARKYQQGSQKVRLRPGSGPGAGKGPTPQSIAGGARGQKATPPPVDPKDQALIEQAHAEIAKKGPNAASAKAYLEHLGVQ